MSHDIFIEKLRKVQLFATDFDGIHTDGKVSIDQDGTESVCCSRKDGLGYEMLVRAGIHACVISKEPNPVVLKRCAKLRIACYQGVADGDGKLEILRKVASKLGLGSDQVLYMGDDLNDLKALEFAGVSITVKDGHPSLMDKVDYVASRNGGDHAIREICELLLEAKGQSLSF